MLNKVLYYLDAIPFGTRFQYFEGVITFVQPPIISVQQRYFRDNSLSSWKLCSCFTQFCIYRSFIILKSCSVIQNCSKTRSVSVNTNFYLIKWNINWLMPSVEAHWPRRYRLMQKRRHVKSIHREARKMVEKGALYTPPKIELT